MSYVLAGEDAQVAHRFGNPVAVAALHEVAAQPFLRYVAGDALDIKPGACGLDRAITDIAAEDLNLRCGAALTQIFQQADRDGINFLAAGATRHPYSHRHLARAARHETREHALGKGVKRLAIAEKFRDPDQQVLAERLGFRG